MKMVTKKKPHVISLNVERVDQLPLPMSAEERRAAEDKLAKMTKYDNEVGLMDELKNEIESYAYNMKDKLEYDASYKAVTTEEARTKVIELSEAADKFAMYEITKETTLEDLQGWMKNLTDAWIPIKEKAFEFDIRSDTVKVTEKELKKIQDGIQKMKETMDWLPKEEFDAAVKKVEDFA